MKAIICTCCPKGCTLQVDEVPPHTVTGNACPRGAEYGKSELLHPVRTVTATVSLQSVTLERLPVKTDIPVPKERIMDVTDALGRLSIRCPVHMGEVLVSGVCGTDANVVATRSVLF